jgi:hypothetical protein
MGCGGGGGSKSDMASIDMSVIGPDMASPGLVGDPCTSTTQCHEGTTPVCWTTTLFNETNKLVTPGGYCSSACTTNSDCGSGKCVSEGSSDGSWCLAACTTPSACRTGYACFRADGGFCFPSQNLSCDPTAGDGTCTGNTPEPGACERLAFGSGKTGECYDGCRPGVGTCSTLNGVARQCTVLDYANDSDGDKFVGPVCDSPNGKNAIGAECLYNGTDYIDACVDGAACYLTEVSANGDNKCHQLCIPGDGGDSCTTGSCTDVWGIFSSANPAGLCI